MRNYYLIIAGEETVAVEVALDEKELDLITKIVIALNEASSNERLIASLTTDSPRYEIDEVVTAQR